MCFEYSTQCNLNQNYFTGMTFKKIESRRKQRTQKAQNAYK